MADFLTAFKHTMTAEGGYANNPRDNGGETYKGIARKFNPGWRGWVKVDVAKRLTQSVAQLNELLGSDEALQADVQDFYKKNYWDVNRLDEVRNQAISCELFDTGVNMGVGVAARFLQEALNLSNRNGQLYADIAVDGKIGSATLATLNKHPNPTQLYKLLNIMQGERYLDILRKAPAQEVFATTWLNRVDFIKV